MPFVCMAEIYWIKFNTEQDSTEGKKVSCSSYQQEANLSSFTVISHEGFI